jgi:hypothetical protein
MTGRAAVGWRPAGRVNAAGAEPADSFRTRHVSVETPAPDPMSRRDKDAAGSPRPRAGPGGAWPVRYHPKAREEADAVPANERKALDRAVDKLASLGPLLAFPHSSKVMGGPGGSLRELRPRAGRSPWRCIYQRIGDVFVVGAVAPEAMKDKAGFERAVRAAKSRLAEIEP